MSVADNTRSLRRRRQRKIENVCFSALLTHETWDKTQLLFRRLLLLLFVSASKTWVLSASAESAVYAQYFVIWFLVRWPVTVSCHDLSRCFVMKRQHLSATRTETEGQRDRGDHISTLSIATTRWWRRRNCVSNHILEKFLFSKYFCRRSRRRRGNIIANCGRWMSCIQIRRMKRRTKHETERNRKYNKDRRTLHRSDDRRLWRLWWWELWMVSDRLEMLANEINNNFQIPMTIFCVTLTDCTRNLSD